MKIDDETTYFLKGIVCCNYERDHAFAVSYIDNKLYYQDICKEIDGFEKIKLAMILVYSLDI